QFFSWPALWHLTAPPGGKLQRGAVVQFVKINFDLYWYDVLGMRKGAKLTEAEIRNRTGFKNPSAYVEVWPIKAFKPTNFGPDHFLLVPDHVDVRSPEETASMIAQGFSPDALNESRESHDIFGAHAEKQKKGFTIVGTVGIEGFALYINDAWGNQWDGASPLGEEGERVFFGGLGGKSLPLTRRPNLRPAGGLLSTPPLTESIERTWTRFVDPVIKKQAHSQ